MLKGVLFIIVFLISFFLLSQKGDFLHERVEAPRDFRVMFYNCENFFDIYNDSLTQDEEFLPGGVKFWSSWRFNEKCHKVSKAIMGAGGWFPIDVVCLAEVENKYVLEQLIYNTNLHKSEYSIIHKDSPDLRGIEVAVLYRKSTFKIISTNWYTIQGERPTRDILYVSGIVKETDTLHLFVNHWPSRWGGQLESEYKRIEAARVLKDKVDSVLNYYSGTKILIVGDLNDSPHDKSVRDILGAGIIEETDLTPDSKNLYDLMNIYDSRIIGTHKYQGRWSILDHIIVSGSLLNMSSNLKCYSNSAVIYNPDFLSERDLIYSGYKPLRTYSGYSYSGGFSDHYPVFIDFYLNK